jgi:hypothetical protein
MDGFFFARILLIKDINQFLSLRKIGLNYRPKAFL